jgi:hypothetical protein
MDENTSKVIAEHENTALKDDIFTQFIAACDQAQKTNDSLKAALQLSHQQGFIDILPALERRGFLLQDGNVLPHTSPSH